MSLAPPLFKCSQPRPGATVRLLAIPHAGGGASTFRTWPEALPESIELWAVQLPGREERLLDPPLSSVGPIATLLADSLQIALDAETPPATALFGHSMGALIAYELLRELRRRGAPPAAHLFASAFRAPRLPNPTPRIHELDDEAFIEELDRRYAAVPEAVRSEPELLELFLPGLRADISVCDSYLHTPEDRLECPVTAFGGEEDTHVTQPELEAWREETDGPFDLRMFSGGHFFLESARDTLLESIAERLSGAGA